LRVVAVAVAAARLTLVFKPVFSAPLQSWREWWGAVREFAAGWYGIAAGEVTGHHPMADALGQELGVSLSPSLHEWRAFTDHLNQAGLLGRALRDRSLLCWDSDTESVLLMQDVEGTVRWAVRPEHLPDQDPPVQMWFDGEPGASPWHRWTPTASQFALQHLIAYLRPAAGGWLLINDIPRSDELIERLKSAGRSSIDLDGQLLIEDDDLIVMAGKSLWSDQGASGIDVEVKIGPSRAGSIPAPLADLTRYPGWAGSNGAFLELRSNHS
jgi:hypothetical protein